MTTHSPHPLRAAALAALAIAAVALAAPGRAAAAYGWPVKPFHVQHPVRGYLGDPRIARVDGVVTRGLHFGVDVSARNGTPVYAVASGTVSMNSRYDDVVFVSSGGVVHEYWHIVPAVRAGYAVARRTVLGTVEKPWAHVHLAEAVNGVYVNPLRPGGLAPYRDTTRPEIVSVRRVADGLVIDALDRTPLEVPRPWALLPVTPALVEWSAGHGWHTVVDFRTVLPDRSFSAVYAPDTTQNHVRLPGHYLFVAHGVPAGAVDVRVADTAGNSSTLTLPASRPVVRTLASRRG